MSLVQSGFLATAYLAFVHFAGDRLVDGMATGPYEKPSQKPKAAGSGYIMGLVFLCLGCMESIRHGANPSWSDRIVVMVMAMILVLGWWIATKKVDCAKSLLTSAMRSKKDDEWKKQWLSLTSCIHDSMAKEFTVEDAKAKFRQAQQNLKLHCSESNKTEGHPDLIEPAKSEGKEPMVLSTLERTASISGQSDHSTRTWHTAATVFSTPILDTISIASDGAEFHDAPDNATSNDALSNNTPLVRPWTPRSPKHSQGVYLAAKAALALEPSFLDLTTVATSASSASEEAPVSPTTKVEKQAIPVMWQEKYASLGRSSPLRRMSKLEEARVEVYEKTGVELPAQEVIAGEYKCLLEWASRHDSTA